MKFKILLALIFYKSEAGSEVLLSQDCSNRFAYFRKTDLRYVEIPVYKD